MSLQSPAAVDAPPRAAPASRRRFPWAEAWAGVLTLSAAAATAAPVAGGGRGDGVFVPAVCLGVAALAAAFDAATGRIPNAVTYTAVLVGLVVNGAALALHAAAPRLADHWLGAAGPTQSVFGLLAFGGVGLVCRLVAGMGGGDMKLLAAVGALLGVSRASDALACGLVVAAAYAVTNLLIAGRLNATVRAAAVLALNAAYFGDLTPTAAASRRSIPLAIPVLAGLVLSRLPPVVAASAWVHGR